MRHNPSQARWRVMHVISNWHPFRVTQWSEAVMYLTNPCRLHSFIQTSLPAALKDRGAERETARATDKYIAVSCLFQRFTFQLCFSFWSPSHLCFITVSLYLSGLLLHLLSVSSFLLSLLPQPLLLSDIFFFQVEVWGQLLLSDLSCFKCSYNNKER